MTTVSFEIATTAAERLARRRILDSYYAGIPCSGYGTSIVSLNPGQQVAVSPGPAGTTLQALMAAVDPNTSIVIGWTGSAGVTEIPLNVLALVTPPADITSLYVRNTAAAGSAVVPVKLFVVYE